jgi:hypothetical protein
MNFSSRPLRTLLPLLLLAACARPDAGRLVTARIDDVSCPPPLAQVLGEHDMLHYYHCLSTLPPARLAAEYAAVNGHFQQTGSGADRVKLALLQSIPTSAAYNPASALALLATPQDGNGIPAGLRNLADLLGATLQRQQAAEQKVQSLQKDLAAEKLHAGALQLKIDSVKNLERTMTQKDGP